MHRLLLGLLVIGTSLFFGTVCQAEVILDATQVTLTVTGVDRWRSYDHTVNSGVSQANSIYDTYYQGSDGPALPWSEVIPRDSNFYVGCAQAEVGTRTQAYFSWVSTGAGYDTNAVASASRINYWKPGDGWTWGSVQVYSPFVNAASPFPEIASGDAYIYRVGTVGLSGGIVPNYGNDTSLTYTAAMIASFRVSGDEAMSRVFITALGAPTPSGEVVFKDSGLLGQASAYADTLSVSRTETGELTERRSWGFSYNVYAVVPLPSVTINVTSGTQTQAQAGYPTLINAPVVTKTGPGTLVMDNANPYTGTTTVSEGTVQITNPLAVQSSPLIVRGGGVIQLPKDTPIVVPAKTIEVEVASGGRIDVGVGLINCFPPDGAGDGWLVDWISAGRDGGSWQGVGGITSSAVVDDAAEGRPRAVGWKENEDGSVTVGYAAPGDTNLDGEVNIFDLVNVNSSGTYGRGVPSNWSQGDFDYNGVTNIFDIVMVNGAGVYGRGRYVPAPASGSVAAVPEPSTYAMALAGIACGGYVVRRRRKLA